MELKNQTGYYNQKYLEAKKVTLSALVRLYAKKEIKPTTKDIQTQKKNEFKKFFEKTGPKGLFM